MQYTQLKNESDGKVKAAVREKQLRGTPGENADTMARKIKISTQGHIRADTMLSSIASRKSTASINPKWNGIRSFVNFK